MAKKRKDFTPKQRHNQDLWRVKGLQASLKSLPLSKMTRALADQLIREIQRDLLNLLDNTNHYDR